MKRLLALLLAALLAVPAYAGRDCDGTNDEIAFGSDASIDNFTARTIALWVRADATGVNQVWVTKGVATNEVLAQSSLDLVRYISDWTTDGNWIGTTDVADAATFHFVCVRYNNSATSNDAAIRVDAVDETLTTDTAPTGSWVADAGNELQVCETNPDAADFDGNISFFTFDNTFFSVADCNRARWWGRAKGGLAVYHPFLTNKLANEGVATANGTATGTTVASSPVPVQRPSSALLNGGVGW